LVLTLAVVPTIAKHIAGAKVFMYMSPNVQRGVPVSAKHSTHPLKS